MLVESGRMLINLLVILVVVGVSLYLLNVLVPMDAKIKTVINCVVGVIIFLYVLQAFGIIHNFPGLK